MYQNTNDNQKSSSVGDIIITIVLLLIIVFVRKLADFFKTLPSPYGVICMLLLLFFIVVSIYLIYKKRLCSYRYSIFYEQPPEGELDEYGHQAAWPYPLGTIIFEKLTGKRGKIYETVLPEETVTLLAPGEEYTDEKVGFFNTTTLSVLNRKTAHTLVFRRKNKLYKIYFHPSEEFMEHVNACPLGQDGKVS